ncbi:MULTISPECIES: hypothetical protein [unclassified Providencia]|uniref:hypothetical protein n=1 Tax=unclassified Providencia TaxID=2633465 RepID=UPI00234A881A|nr:MULTISPECIES: hypothetical protein [unclassified Providencia]
MSILYLIQNDTHMKNFKTLMNENDKYIDLGKLTGQKLFGKELLIGQEIFLPIENTNFFKLPPLERLLFVLKNRKKIKKELSTFKFKSVIIGNDGALQKLIIESLPDKKICIDMWLDGLISLNSSKYLNTFKIINSKLFEYLNLAFFVPSVIGFYKKIRILYVMHDSVLSEYKKFGLLINTNKIKPITFPRHKELLQKIKKLNSDRIIVLYLTSAWEFHGKTAEQQIQREQILDLINLFKDKKAISFRIRVHPRDSDDIYSNSDVSQWLSDSSNFEDDIINSHFVISARSTGLLEAEMISKKVIIYNKGFGDKYLNEYTQTLTRYDSTSEILTLVTEYQIN